MADDGMPSIECEVCGESFGSAAELAQHMEQHREDGPAAPGEDDAPDEEAAETDAQEAAVGEAQEPGTEEPGAEETADDVEEAAEGEGEADSGSEGVYELAVEGSIEDVKDRVLSERLDPEKVMEAEQAGQNREALIEWLYDHVIEDYLYEEIVSGSAEDIRGWVEGDELEPAKVIESEQAGKAREELLEWLYTELVDMPVDAVKDAVRTHDIDPVRVLEAERAGDARSTLVGWLEERTGAAVREGGSAEEADESGDEEETADDEDAEVEDEAAREEPGGAEDEDDDEEDEEDAEEAEPAGEEPSGEIDYDELVDGTVDEVKDAVEARDDIDIEAVLEAERAGDDRVTLTDWLEERMAPDAEEEPAEPEEGETEEPDEEERDEAGEEEEEPGAEMAQEEEEADEVAEEIPEKYTELVEGTVEEVQEAVEADETLDLGMVLEAERAGKDRTTLTDWLEDRIEEQTGELAVEMERVPTGIEGLDEMFITEIPRGNTVVIEGSAGSGKTLMSLQMLYNAVKRGEKALFMSFEEPKDALIHHMLEFGWDVRPYVESGQLRIENYSTLDVTKSVEALLSQAEGSMVIEIKPRIFPDDFDPDVVVLDSLTSISSAFTGEESRFRIYMEQLFNYIKEQEMTAFLIKEAPVPAHTGENVAAERTAVNFLADGILALYNAIGLGGDRQRALEIVKMRGCNFESGVRKFDISDEGITVYPDAQLEGGYKFT